MHGYHGRAGAGAAGQGRHSYLDYISHLLGFVVLGEVILHLARDTDWLKLEGIRWSNFPPKPPCKEQRCVAVEKLGTTRICFDSIHKGGMRREKETTFPNHISSDMQNTPVPYRGTELVLPRCCLEADSSLCGLFSLWETLWHPGGAGICWSHDDAGCHIYLPNGNIGL